MSDLHDRIHGELISHLLCKFNPKSPKKKTIDIVREIACKRYSTELVEEFIATKFEILRTAVVDEFNYRTTNDLALRFAIVDDAAEGYLLSGNSKDATDDRLRFQDSLHEIDPTLFEDLAAVILKKFGCETVFRTPQSHDQGVDAFGYKVIVPSLSSAVTHNLVWIAQAKHYIKYAMSTNAVRELIGTNELLISKIFSTVDARYKDLELLPYSPTALIVITTHEFPSTVRRLASRSGVFILEATDLYDLLKIDLKKDFSAANLRALISAKSKSIDLIK